MIDELLLKARERRASDLHLSVGSPVMIRVDGLLTEMSTDVLKIEDTTQCAEEMGLDGKTAGNFLLEKDFAYENYGGRYRVNVYLHQDTLALAIRIIPDVLPSVEALRLPEIVGKFAELNHGLVIVTGSTGSGKTTTLAALVDRINALRYVHIVTLEDPVEYRHGHRRALVTQREVGRDTESFASGLRSALRQDPDVILVGELRDRETMEIALNAAETGHLVLTTMHTKDATEAVNRILDTCADKEVLVRGQLSSCLQGIIAQKLVPGVKGGRVAACEILTATQSVRTAIREGKVYQIPNSLQTGLQFGMQTMDVAILKLRRDGLIK